jgi:hypothetical protein
MVGDTHDLARLDASRLLLQRQSSERHGLFILLELELLDGRQGTLLGSPAVCLFLAACKVEVDAVAANFVLVIVPTLVAGPMSAHDHPGLSDVTISSTSKRSGALRSRDGLGSASSIIGVGGGLRPGPLGG